MPAIINNCHLKSLLVIPSALRQLKSPSFISTQHCVCVLFLQSVLTSYSSLRQEAIICFHIPQYSIFCSLPQQNSSTDIDFKRFTMDLCCPKSSVCPEEYTKVFEVSGEREQLQVKSDSQSLCHTGQFGLFPHSFIFPLSSQISLSPMYILQTPVNLLAVPCHKTLQQKQQIMFISKATES